MSDAGRHDGADGQGTGSSGMPLRPASPSRLFGPGPLHDSDPRSIGEYHLVGQLGIGGMGTVYLGQDPDGNRVAVKLVHAHLARDARFRARFAGEVRAAQRVPGFSTARVLDTGIYENRPYLVTEYLDGIPLSRLVVDDGPLDPATLHSVSIGVAAALAAIHGTGLVHRDLKPSNLMVTLGGVRIIDFGIARALDTVSDVTGTGNIVGSLGWASPEQLRAEEPRASMDIFGWGCLIAFAATGRHPFGGEEAAARAWRILEGEPDLSGIPDPVRELVGACLERDPALRPTARQLLLALTVDDMTLPPEPVPPRRWLRPRGTGGPGSRRRLTTMVIAVPLALTLVFAVAETTSELMGNPTSIADAGAPNAPDDGAALNGATVKPRPGGTTPSQRRDQPLTITTPAVATTSPHPTANGAGSTTPKSPSPTPTNSATPTTTTPAPPTSEPPSTDPSTAPPMDPPVNPPLAPFGP